MTKMNLLEELGWSKAIENEEEVVWIKVEKNGERVEGSGKSGESGERVEEGEVELTMIKVEKKTGDIRVESTRENGAKMGIVEMEEFIEEAKRFGVEC